MSTTWPAAAGAGMTAWEEPWMSGSFDKSWATWPQGQYSPTGRWGPPRDNRLADWSTAPPAVNRVGPPADLSRPPHNCTTPNKTGRPYNAATTLAAGSAKPRKRQAQEGQGGARTWPPVPASRRPPNYNHCCTATLPGRCRLQGLCVEPTDHLLCRTCWHVQADRRRPSACNTTHALAACLHHLL